MSDFLKFAFEVLSQVVYNIAGVIAAAIKLLVTGWRDYFTIFFTYFGTLSLVAKILSILLMLILIAIPILAVILLVRYWMLRRRLRGDKEDNAELYREIGRLNRQVLDLIEEKTGSRPASLAVISNEFHLYRAGLMAKSCGVTMLGVPAATYPLPLRLHYYFREAFGVAYYMLFGR